jgi:hypothetical protein
MNIARGIDRLFGKVVADYLDIIGSDMSTLLNVEDRDPLSPPTNAQQFWLPLLLFTMNVQQPFSSFLLLFHLLPTIFA